MAEAPSGFSAPSEYADLPIPYARVECGDEEMRNVREVLESGWLTTGPKTAAFEKAFAEAVGAQYALAVNSCTAALHLAAEAVGVGPGDKVVVPTMTFTATAEVVRYLGADPVLVDVEYDTALLDPEAVGAVLEKTPDVKAVMAVHFGGQAADVLGEDGHAGLLDICHRHGVRLIEDAAHAFPARAGGRMVGSLGDATCFSFYANKTITTGEGGMLTTDDPEIARRASVMRLHGIDRDAWDRYTLGSKRPGWEYDIVAPGYKYNMPDIAAAVGLAQLKRAEDFRRERQRVAARYAARLADLDRLDLPRLVRAPSDHAWHLYPVVLRDEAPLSRNRLIEDLWDRGIRTSVHYKPLHRTSYYRDTYNLDPAAFPNAERIWRGNLSLPIYPSLPDAAVDYICDTLHDMLA